MATKKECELTIDVERVSPVTAMRLLSAEPPHGMRQRTRSESYARALSRDMLKNGYALTHQGIATFDDWPLDGQHRLRAIILSGVTITTPVARYLTRDAALAALAAIDQHRKRHRGDVLEINGTVANRGRERAAVGALCSLLDDSTSVAPTFAEVSGAVKAYLAEHTSIAAAMPGASAVQLAPVVWAAARDPRVIEVARGLWKVANGVVETLARDEIRSTENGGGSKRVVHCFRVLRALRAVLDGEELKSIKTPTRERVMQMWKETE